MLELKDIFTKIFNTGENDPRIGRNITRLHTAEDLSKIILRYPQQSKIIRTNIPSRTIRSGFIKSCNFSRNVEINTRKYQFSTETFETQSISEFSFRSNNTVMVNKGLNQIQFPLFSEWKSLYSSKSRFSLNRLSHTKHKNVDLCTNTFRKSQTVLFSFPYGNLNSECNSSNNTLKVSPTSQN